MSNTCVFCHGSFDVLVLLTSDWVMALGLDSGNESLACNLCGQLHGIFCLKNHNCYCVHQEDGSSYCPQCLAYYRSIAEHSVKITKAISKEFLEYFRASMGRSEVLKFQTWARASNKKLYVKSAQSCAYNAACGNVTCERIIMEYSYCKPKAYKFLAAADSFFIPSRN